MSEVIEKQDFSKVLVDSIDLSTFKEAKGQRESALSTFENLGLPGNKSEEYKFTPITRAISKAFQSQELIQSAKGDEAALKELLLDDYKENAIVFVNGIYSKTLSKVSAESGVTVMPLKEAVAENQELASFEGSDPFEALNGALWADGIFVHVAKNTVAQMPLLIQHLHDATAAKSAVHSKVVVKLDQNASLSVVEKTDLKGDQPVFQTISENITVDENATFNYYKIQNDPGQLIQVANTTITQKKSSRTNTYTITLDGKLIRNNLNINIEGEGCESHFYGLYLTQGDTLVDNHTTVDHKQPNSFSNELYKGLMDGKSKGVFNGKIFVRPHAQKTNAFQSNRNILLSDTATVNTKPQLEIWADDVKCSHGCTTGQLDDEALFYLQSRGIPKATAKAMLLYAFVGEVIEAIEDEGIRNLVDGLVSERLHKGY
ncbi:MAG: Fe-S cluster assembly protein SufD [Cyclobacteriaceae bacterium]